MSTVMVPKKSSTEVAETCRNPGFNLLSTSEFEMKTGRFGLVFQQLSLVVLRPGHLPQVLSVRGLLHVSKYSSGALELG